MKLEVIRAQRRLIDGVGRAIDVDQAQTARSDRPRPAGPLSRFPAGPLGPHPAGHDLFLPPGRGLSYCNVMETLNLKRIIPAAHDATLDSMIERVTAALKTEGFGVLTRIDLHQKIRDKLGKEMPAVVILGACNPQLAYEAYQHNSDVTALLPCNAVIRDLGNGQHAVELAKPSVLMQSLGDPALVELAREADRRLERALQAL